MLSVPLKLLQTLAVSFAQDTIFTGTEKQKIVSFPLVISHLTITPIWKKKE